MSLSKGEFFRLLKKSGLLTTEDRVEAKRQCQGLKDKSAADVLVERNLLTPWQAAQLNRGRTKFFIGKYKLLKFRGRGAMGIVFKALHPELNRTVAVKILSNSLLGNPRSVSRFLREIRSAAVLNHPNIVIAYDADQIGKTYCLVMEYISGRSLKALFLEKGKLPALWCCECARQTALALDHIHSRGLVHRDVKPSNLIVTVRPSDNRLQIKLLDVGLARFVSEAEQDGSLTRDGQIVGTGDYMAPEQVAKAREADIRADIYGLGATLFQLITGTAPLAGETLLQTYMNRLQHEPPLLSTLAPSIPRGLDTVVAKMLKRSPQERYQKPVEVAADLAAVLAGAPTESAPQIGKPLALAAPAPDFFWAAVDPGDDADSPNEREFVDIGDSLAEGFVAGPEGSSGTASSGEAMSDTAADGSLNDFLRQIDASASAGSTWSEAGRRRAKPKTAGINTLKGGATRAVRFLVQRLSRKKRTKSAGDPPKKSTRKKRRSKTKRPIKPKK
jgi:serine/threonine protein kinase